MATSRRGRSGRAILPPAPTLQSRQLFPALGAETQGDERAIDRLPQTNRTLFLKLGYALVL